MPQEAGLFYNAVLREAIDLLPTLPDTPSLLEIKKFLRTALHFSAAQTRERDSRYIVHRMFPQGYADRGLLLFARKHAGQQALRDVCYYRFCAAEPLMREIVDNLLIPNIGTGHVDRRDITDYLTARFPSSKSIGDCLKAIVRTLLAGGLVRTDPKRIFFGYRDISLSAFPFILTSEFPEPGMHDIAKLEHNQAIRAMLWRPDQIIPTLYEMRNKGLVAKVSEIDSVRQFTTKWKLEEVVDRLTAGGY